MEGISIMDASDIAAGMTATGVLFLVTGYMLGISGVSPIMTKVMFAGSFVAFFLAIWLGVAAGEFAE